MGWRIQRKNGGSLAQYFQLFLIFTSYTPGDASAERSFNFWASISICKTCIEGEESNLCCFSFILCQAIMRVVGCTIIVLITILVNRFINEIPGFQSYLKRVRHAMTCFYWIVVTAWELRKIRTSFLMTPVHVGTMCAPLCWYPEHFDDENIAISSWLLDGSTYTVSMH